MPTRTSELRALNTRLGLHHHAKDDAPTGDTERDKGLTATSSSSMYVVDILGRAVSPSSSLLSLSADVNTRSSPLCTEPFTESGVIDAMVEGVVEFAGGIVFPSPSVSIANLCWTSEERGASPPCGTSAVALETYSILVGARLDKT
jgi:hypothetical protein